MSSNVIFYLQAAHGLLNSLVFAALLYQAWLGLKIRRTRIAGRPPAVQYNLRHRKLGPRLALTITTGYLAGVVITLLNNGTLLKWPLHLILGTGIVALAGIAYLVSNRIKGRPSPWRTPHFLIGLMIIALYPAQILTGLVVLM